MTFEHNDMSASLFDNDRKERDNQPDMKGSGKIDGQEYWISAWIKNGAKGDYLSIAFTEKDGQSSGHSNSRSKTGSFLSKKTKPAKQQIAESKFEREQREFDMITGKVPKDENFDDDIPF